jgi:hypothetical protein
MNPTLKRKPILNGLTKEPIFIERVSITNICTDTQTVSEHNSPAATGELSAHASKSFRIVDLSNDQRKVIKVWCQCTDSAIRSTIAFDRVGASENSSYKGYKSKRRRRLVITNIFSTLHAQFENMLVLVTVASSLLLIVWECCVSRLYHSQ